MTVSKDNSTVVVDEVRVPRGQAKRGGTVAPWSRPAESHPRKEGKVAILTGGGDKPYALGMAAALIGCGIHIDFIGSDELDVPELRGTPLVRFLNLRGDQLERAGFVKKAFRVLLYYGRLICYAAAAKPKLFHILWNNKFQFFDRTLLMLYYKLLGKQVLFTAHNVNAGKRDSTDSYLNRITLKIQYRLADHIFVHTGMMKTELMTEFAVPDAKVSVIPFGVNSTVPSTELTTAEAKQRLGLGNRERTLLFFGLIAPYKGLEYLVEALGEVRKKRENYRLIIAGKPKGCEDYWEQIQRKIDLADARKLLIERIEFIPDEDVEKYFKAADVLILPYRHVFQSGVLFLAYNFGLPVIVADVGSLKDDVEEGKTGLVFRAEDSIDLARTIEAYFASDLYQDLENRRPEIRAFAHDKYSWAKVGEITRNVYEKCLES